jgi:hypothetical protein
MDGDGERITGFHRAFALVGFALLLAVGLLVAASSLVAPPWGVIVLWIVWITAAVWAARTWRRRAFAPLIAGAATIVFWVGFINFGDIVLGWTA